MRSVRAEDIVAIYGPHAERVMNEEKAAVVAVVILGGKSGDGMAIIVSRDNHTPDVTAAHLVRAPHLMVDMAEQLASSVARGDFKNAQRSVVGKRGN